jgi:outer membrane receptor protein involved in Fe transport
MGGEYRKETFTRSFDAAGALEPFHALYSRAVKAAFVEAGIPLLSNRWTPGGPAALELKVAGRYEHYSDFGHTVNPELRVRWVPFRTLKLRGSWGTSVRAPTLDDLHDTADNVSGETMLVDPKSPTGRSLVLVLQGTNPGLQPETATTWTVGLDWVPEAIDGLTASVTYYTIDYRDQIALPADASIFDILVNERQWSGVIARDPTRDQVLAICNRPDYFQPRTDCINSSPAAIVDIRLANLGVTQTQGVDLDLRQVIDGSFGRLAVGLLGTEILRFDQAASSTAPAVGVLNTMGNPTSLRMRGTMDWARRGGNLSGPGVSIALNYTGGYRDAASTLVPRISSSFTVDGQLRYRMANTEVNLNVVNLFNRSPPFVDWLHGYDWNAAQPLGRVTSISLRKGW